MHSLSSIVGGVLSQLTEAQACSDAATLMAGYKYAEHEHLKFFDIPQISILEADVELKFAFASDDKKSIKANFNSDQSMGFIDKLNTTLKQLAQEREFIKLFDLGSVEEDKWEKIVNTMLVQVRLEIANNVEIEVNQLVRSILLMLKSKLVTAFAEHHQVLDKVRKILHFAQNKTDSSEAAKWLDDFRLRLRRLIVLALGLNALDSELSVLVTSEDLMKLPPNSVSKITFKTGLARKQWIGQVENGVNNRRLTEV